MLLLKIFLAHQTIIFHTACLHLLYILLPLWSYWDRIFFSGGWSFFVWLPGLIKRPLGSYSSVFVGVWRRIWCWVKWNITADVRASEGCTATEKRTQTSAVLLPRAKPESAACQTHASICSAIVGIYSGLMFNRLANCYFPFSAESGKTEYNTEQLERFNLSFCLLDLQ